MRISRFPSITEPQFFGCVSAFVDSLTGELNAAVMALRRLEGSRKGAAFAHEIALDTHRYGALIVLDRWRSLTTLFGPHLQLSHGMGMLENAAARVEGAENVLARANTVIDASESYDASLVEACILAFHSVPTTFDEERREAEQAAKLGPMLPEDYRDARRIFLEDLAAR